MLTYLKFIKIWKSTSLTSKCTWTNVDNLVFRAAGLPFETWRSSDGALPASYRGTGPGHSSGLSQT